MVVLVVMVVVLVVLVVVLLLLLFLLLLLLLGWWWPGGAAVGAGAGVGVVLGAGVGGGGKVAVGSCFGDSGGGVCGAVAIAHLPEIPRHSHGTSRNLQPRRIVDEMSLVCEIVRKSQRWPGSSGK